MRLTSASPWSGGRYSGAGFPIHELPVTESILRVLLRHAEEARAGKVVSVSLRIWELSDIIEEWLQRNFDYLSKGTLAEGRHSVRFFPAVEITKERCFPNGLKGFIGLSVLA